MPRRTGIECCRTMRIEAGAHGSCGRMPERAAGQIEYVGELRSLGRVISLKEAANRKDGDAHHLPVAALRTLQWIVPGQLLPPFPVVAFRWRDGCRHRQQFPAPGQILRAVAVAEKAVGAAALKSIGEAIQ